MDLTSTQCFLGQKKNVVLPFTHFCTKHFGLLDKPSLSNPLLFWNFVQKQFKSKADFIPYFLSNSQESLQCLCAVQ